ncbi:MAG: DUF3572 domain-containing protein [Rhizobium sp.]|nr:DUF3572 domain-containing protein [Rhizobium sp.]
MPDRRRSGTASLEEAEGAAIQILGWIVGQPDLITRFLALTGIEASSIRQAAAEPGFLAGVTGFVMAHEPTLMAYCAESGVRIEYVAACHQALAGSADENWP